MGFAKFLGVGLLAFCTPAVAMDFGPLVEPSDLASASTAQVLDIRAPKSFAQGHLAGAVNIPYGQFRGPKENPGRMPDVAFLEGVLEQGGLRQDAPVVVVSQGNSATDFGATARVYWQLKSLGFEKLSILNGGVQAWGASGLALSTVPHSPEPSSLDLTFDDTWFIDRAAVQEVVNGTSEAVLLDARPHAFFEGQQKHPAAALAGTLAGALNISHDTWFLGEDPVIRPQETDLARIRAIVADADGAPLVSFCNTGHWAATNWFVASELADVKDVKLFPESMVGWTLARLPVVGG